MQLRARFARFAAMLLRPYEPADRDACLVVFDSNVPAFFAPHEREGFASFLGDLDR
ncbi:MAG: family N-acetyltransferase, partial [Myxococcaceae bacterium]|nr:family N-acetyltransferase [Myxococcaceae bacterium]